MTDFALLATFALILPALNWTAAGVLWAAHRRRPRLRWLYERAVAAAILAACSTIGGLVFIDALGVDHFLDADRLAIMAALMLFFISIPALYWLWLYLVRGLPGDES